MNDRELLEKAAKAAGIEGYKFLIGAYAKSDALGIPMCNYGTSNQRAWNPLTDDGDALRLAIDLHIDVCFNNQEEGVTAWSDAIGDWIAEKLAPNHYTATRRAIVRAAAEIGKEMK